MTYGKLQALMSLTEVLSNPLHCLAPTAFCTRAELGSSHKCLSFNPLWASSSLKSERSLR